MNSATTYGSKRILYGLLIVAAILTIATGSYAQSRFFVPDFHVGKGVDTQLLINNRDTRDGTVDVWAFSKAGELLGQAQVRLKAQATRSFTLSELFGSGSTEKTGWVAAFSTTDSSELSYRIVGSDSESETREAELMPSRRTEMDVASGRTLKLSNPSSEPNRVTVRTLDENHDFVGVKDVAIAPFGQVEVALPPDRGRVQLDSAMDFLAFLDETHREAPAPSAVEQTGTLSESAMAIVIDSEIPIGAFQLVLKFDPQTVKFSADDIQAGTSEGFDSKPLAVGIDNAAGEIRIASFQLGNRPNGSTDVAHLRIRSLSSGSSRFGIKVEEITDLKGDSILDTLPTVRLTRIR